MKKSNGLGKILSKIIIYIALFALAISIIVPVGWVFMASVKEMQNLLVQILTRGRFRQIHVGRTLNRRL